jgi:hypothetical protein
VFFALRFSGNYKKMLTDISEVSFSGGHDDGVFTLVVAIFLRFLFFPQGMLYLR